MPKQLKKGPPRRPDPIDENLPTIIRLTCEAAELQLAAAEAGEGKSKVRSFSMTAYTGGPMNIAGYYWPVVVDLEGMEVRSQTRPILFGHDINRIVGHSEAIEKSAQRVKVAGRISGVGDDSRNVMATADNGFPWQSSIGCEVKQLEFVDRGNTVKVNGRVCDGPVYVARKTSLREISFAALGADDNTSASIAASHPHQEQSMTFQEWLKAKGDWDEKTLSPTQTKFLRAMYDEENGSPEIDPPTPVKLKATVPAVDEEDVTRQLRTIHAKESNRVAKIQAVVAKYGTKTIKIDDKDVPLEAHAIEQGWTPDQTELHALRASRPTGPAIHIAGDAPTTPNVLEAALCMTAAMPNVEKVYKPEILEAANKHYRGMGLHQLVLMAACANGYSARPGQGITKGNIRAVLEHAFPPRSIHAAATTFSLPGVLGNVANAEILQGYMEEDAVWREISSVKSVSNFFQVTSYRLLDNMEYEELSPTGEIKHGAVSEESYTRQAKTYAKMLALTRTDIINDNLGAFDDLRTKLGRGAGKKLNKVFWTKFINNSAFFTLLRTNYIEGATSNLGIDGVGLGLGVKAVRSMTSPIGDGKKRVGAGQTPKLLLVGPSLEAAAEILFKNTNLGGVKSSDANIYAAKYRPVVAWQLEDLEYTGYSTTAWYLFADPRVAAPMCVSFLDGVETPTVESADADFDTLGIQFRGFHDFGCDTAEYLCGVKSKGAA